MNCANVGTENQKFIFSLLMYSEGQYNSSGGSMTNAPPFFQVKNLFVQKSSNFFRDVLGV